MAFPPCRRCDGVRIGPQAAVSMAGRGLEVDQGVVVAESGECPGPSVGHERLVHVGVASPEDCQESAVLISGRALDRKSPSFNPCRQGRTSLSTHGLVEFWGIDPYEPDPLTAA